MSEVLFKKPIGKVEYLQYKISKFLHILKFNFLVQL